MLMRFVDCALKFCIGLGVQKNKMGKTHFLEYIILCMSDVDRRDFQIGYVPTVLTFQLSKWKHTPC